MLVGQIQKWLLEAGLDQFDRHPNPVSISLYESILLSLNGCHHRIHHSVRHLENIGIHLLEQVFPVSRMNLVCVQIDVPSSRKRTHRYRGRDLELPSDPFNVASGVVDTRSIEVRGLFREFLNHEKKP